MDLLLVGIYGMFDAKFQMSTHYDFLIYHFKRIVSDRSHRATILPPAGLTLTIWLAFPFVFPLETGHFTQFSTISLAVPSVLGLTPTSSSPSPEASGHSNLTGI